MKSQSEGERRKSFKTSSAGPVPISSKWELRGREAQEGVEKLQYSQEGAEREQDCKA